MDYREIDYTEDDSQLNPFWPRLTELTPPFITSNQIEWAKCLITQVREFLAQLGKRTPPTQSWPSMPEDGDSDGELHVEWNVRHQHHFSLFIHRSGLTTWSYLNYNNHKSEWGEWEIQQDTKIPEVCYKFMELIGV